MKNSGFVGLPPSTNANNNATTTTTTATATTTNTTTTTANNNDIRNDSNYHNSIDIVDGVCSFIGSVCAMGSKSRALNFASLESEPDTVLSEDLLVLRTCQTQDCQTQDCLTQVCC